MTDLRARAAMAQPDTADGEVTVGRDRYDEPPTDKAPPADVDTSGILASTSASVFVAWSRVMDEVQSIGKGTSKGLNYEFRGIDAVLNAVGPALRKHGVTVVPVSVAPTYEVITSKSGAVMNYCRVVVSYAVFGPTGDQLPVAIVSAGEAFDTGDKSTTKAQSVALRTMYINALAIPVNAPERDTEYGVQHERGVPEPPRPSEYLAEITNEATTLGRLRQIRSELNDHPEIGSATFEVDGDETSLMKLVVKVGRERAAEVKA